jgi:hypothetical protein
MILDLLSEDLLRSLFFAFTIVTILDENYEKMVYHNL